MQRFLRFVGCSESERRSSTVIRWGGTLRWSYGTGPGADREQLV